jgi:3-hydroxy-9,10-secoandrosta-1,3,5(10)-triene-9,17-dione monooxygenase
MANERRISRAEVLERARGIASAVAPNVGRAEELRRMPPENVAAMMGSGLMPLMRPARFGGLGGDWFDLMHACVEVGRVCGSTAWCLSFLIHHQWIFSYFGDAPQKLVYGTHRDPKFVVSFAPVGKLVQKPGGWEISGEWPWGSGGDHCDWSMVVALVPVAGGIEPRMFLLQPGQFRIRDVWHSVGLRGSGTNNIVVDPVFVPAEHTMNIDEAREGVAPGCSLDDGVLFRSSFSAQPWMGLVSPLLGAARGGCEAFIDYTRSKISTFGEKSAESGSIQNAIGESLAELDAAYLLVERCNDVLFTEQPIKLEQRVRNRRNATMAGRLGLRAIDRLFDLAGAQGLTDAGALQRQWRDAHAIAHHYALAGVAFQNAGRLAMGLDMSPSDQLW